MKKILFVVPTLAGGGAERVVSVLSNELCKQGYNVAILLSFRQENEYYLNPDVKLYVDETYQINAGNIFKKIARVFRRIRSTRKKIQDFKPDAIIPFLPSIMRDTYFADLGIKNIFVGTMRNAPIGLSSFSILVQNHVFKHSDRIYLQTEAQKDFIPKQTTQKTFVLPNPVNEVALNARWEKNKHDVIELIMMGRLHKQKNYPMLIDAVCIAHEEYPNVRLRVFGQGPLKDELQALIESKNASEFITLCGRTSNPVEELQKSDIFVFSSDYEGMPNALMEAMAVGVPCISTDCPTGPKDLIGDNERGLLVPVGDSHAMADAIIRMIENPAMAEEMGKKAKQYVTENFAPKIIAQQLIGNLERIK